MRSKVSRRQVIVSSIIAIAVVGTGASAFGQMSGPSSSKPSYVLPVAPGVVTKSILTVGDSVNNKPDGSPYRLVGIPDGTGAYDNGDGTFTFLVNHELGTAAGITRAHGSAGAFVSSWIVDKSDLSVRSGKDLITSVAPVAGGTAPFGRFCSADLPEVGAFFNPASGLGTTERIFMKGEEIGAEGRAFGTIVSTGEAHYLPKLGKFSWENSVASPFAQNKTVVVGLDDSTPGQVYVYVGDKTATGSVIDKAGLNNGKLYGLKAPVARETTVSGAAAGAFSLVDMSDVVSPSTSTSGALTQTTSVVRGVTEFARPEDGAWDPKNPNDFYFVTTGGNTGTGTVPNRLYRVSFIDIAQPELGGTVTAVLTGTNSSGNTSLPFAMDNLTVVSGLDGRTRVLIQEDPGNSSRLARIWMYTPDSGELLEVATHDAALFTNGQPGFITQDEEASGIIPAWDILGPGWFLQSDQIHAGIAGELVEQGQLSAIFIPQSIPEPTSAGLLFVAGAALLRRRK